MSAAAPAAHRRLDPQSAAWLAQLRAEWPVRDAAIRRLHGLLLREARYEITRRAGSLAHPSGRDLEDLAVQAADDALLAILSKLDDFRGDARFVTWAKRFAALEVPGKVRRRLGHTRELPTDADRWPADLAAHDDPQRLTERRELARTVGRLIAVELTAHQREVLLAMAIDEVSANRLALRLHSTPGALYKTLHDARAKLRAGLAVLDGSDDPVPRRSRSDDPGAARVKDTGGAAPAVPRIRQHRATTSATAPPLGFSRSSGIAKPV